MQHKVPTIQEIARILNLSKSTVSRALRNHHSIGLRTTMRVQKLAKELNYEPDQTAISFKQRKTFSIGVIMPSFETYFCNAIYGIEDVAHARNFNVLIGQTREDYEREVKIMETMRKQRVDGIITSMSKNTPDIGHFLKCRQYNIPLVFLDRVPDVPDINSVWCSLYSSTLEAISLLISRGHKRIGLIEGPPTLHIRNERLKGYLDGHRSHKIPVHDHLITTTDLSAASTYAAMEKILSSRIKPTAIIAFNDYVSLDAMHYIKKIKKGSPSISFVSYSNLPSTEYMDHPPLASVEQFPYEQGKRATELLFRQIDGMSRPEMTPMENLILESKLVIH
mgnify:CR=1 FL=1